MLIVLAVASDLDNSNVLPALYARYVRPCSSIYAYMLDLSETVELKTVNLCLLFLKDCKLPRC